MKITTTRFGEVEVSGESTYAFPEGILGFGDIRSFVLLDHPRGGPFRWLQAIEVPALAFVVTDPAIFFPSYRVAVRAEDVSSIRLEDIRGGFVLVILTVNRETSGITANLQGPLVFNPAGRLAKQVVLADREYTTRHPLVPVQKP